MCVIQVIIDRVIAIKQVAWPYPKDSQIKWLEENLDNEDLHVFLREGNDSVAYLNLHKINITINNKYFEGFGIGNVCAKVKGCGYGSHLLRLTNDYLVSNNKVGLLFCHTPLVKFYSGCNWNLLHSEKCLSPKLDEGICAMTYNAPDIIDTLHYNGKLF